MITNAMSRKFPKVRGMLSRSSIVKKTRVVHVNYIEEDEKNIPQVVESVSYTHLTLPPICSV